MAGEAKARMVADPFAESDGSMEKLNSLEKVTDQGISTRGQIIAYTAKLHSFQHRCFSFSFLICGQYARLFRWDRSGCVAMRALSKADLDRLRERNLERLLWLYREWITEIHWEAAFTTPPYVHHVWCNREKQCRAAWEWIWADGVRHWLTHPFQPSGG